MNANYLSKKSPPKIFDNKYEYVKDLGAGGFGKVVLAKEKISNRFVAIKQLIKASDNEQKVIVREIQAVAKFNLPGVVGYYHHFWENGQLHIVMEYCDGESLADVIGKKKIEPATALLWTQVLAETISVVHEKDIIHHDIKPQNILFTEDGVIKIADFGLVNTTGGTRAYMAPERLYWDANNDDPRSDVYSLGVTLVLMLTGSNPFSTKTIEEILEIHERSRFGLETLPHWQQEIVLKAIHKIPELRFQSMKEFATALRAKHVPFVIDKTTIEVGKIALKANQALFKKNWPQLQYLIEYADQQLPANVNMLKVAGQFFLLKNQTDKALAYFERALRINPRLDVQKELGWINLELRKYPTAISMLTDHLHRNPVDFEAYNLLLQCFIETGRFEPAFRLGETLIKAAPEIMCFRSNTHLAKLLFDKFEAKTIVDFKGFKSNFFTDYNLAVIHETDDSVDHTDWLDLTHKLLFHDFRFNAKSLRNFSLSITDQRTGEIHHYSHPIIKIGRTNYALNHIEIPGRQVSRRHCVIVNSANEVILYDLNSTGTLVNGIKVNRKIQLIGLNTIEIAGVEFIVNSDDRKLL